MDEGIFQGAENSNENSLTFEEFFMLLATVSAQKALKEKELEVVPNDAQDPDQLNM